jgi:hypothetical protein
MMHSYTYCFKSHECVKQIRLIFTCDWCESRDRNLMQCRGPQLCFKVLPCACVVMHRKACQIEVANVVIHLGMVMCKWMMSCDVYQIGKWSKWQSLSTF